MPFIAVRFCLEDCQERLTQIYGQPVAAGIAGVGDAATILARMLSNLKSFTCTGRREKLWQRLNEFAVVAECR